MSKLGKIIKIDQQVIDQYNSEDVMFFPLKESEAIVLLAFVPYIQWTTRWDNLTYSQNELNKLSASIAYGLMNPQEGEIMSVEEICEGVKCAIQPMLEGALAGILNGVTFQTDDEGNIVFAGEGDETGLPANITQQRERMGRMEYVRNRVAEYLQNWADFYSFQTPATETVMERLLTAKYLLDPVKLEASISEYITYRTAPNPTLAYGVVTLQRDYYCLGATLAVTNNYMIDGGAEEDLLMVLSVLDPLTQEQFDTWYAEADNQISDDFVNTECYVFPEFTIVIDNSLFDTDFNGRAAFLSNVVYPNRKYNIKISGLMTSADGLDTYDGVTFNDDGVLSYDPVEFTTTNGANGTFPTGQPPLDSSPYDLVYNLISGQEAQFPADMRTWTGSLTLTFKDFGSIV